MRLPALLLSCTLFSLPNWAADATPKFDDAALEAAMKKMGSADFDERQKAREELLDLSEQFYARLAVGLKSEDPEIRRGTEDVLAGLNARITSARLCARMKPDEMAAFKELRRAEPELIERLGHADPGLRMKALKRLEELKSALAVSLATALTLDNDLQVRRKAVKALGEIGRPEAFNRLKEMTEFTEPPEAGDDMNGNAMQMRNIRMMQMVNMRNGMKNAPEVPEVKTAAQLAILAIGKLKTPEAATFLIEKIKAGTGAPSLDLIAALGATKQDKVAVPALMEYVENATSVMEAGRTAQPGVRIQTSISMNINGKTFDPGKIQVGDFVLSTILDLTGQDAANYGMENPPNNMNMMMAGQFGLTGFNPGDYDLKTFPDDAARKKAREQLKAWFPEWQLKNTGKVNL